MSKQFWNSLVKISAVAVSSTVTMAPIAALAAPPVTSGAPTAQDSQWPMTGQNFAGTRFSPLDEINPQNAAQLKVSWSFNLGGDVGIEATPLVVGTTLYVVTRSPNVLVALDLAQPQGARVLKWRYEPKPVPASQGVTRGDVVGRDACYADGRVFMNTVDGHTIAVDAATGQEIWKTQVADLRIGETITTAPLVASGKVIVGNSGGKGGRGCLKALDTTSGQVLWTAYSNGPGSGTWVSYDPHLNLIYCGTAADGLPAIEANDNADKCGVIARDPDTGDARWFSAWSPQHEFDQYGGDENILADLPLNRATRRVLLHAEGNGNVYVVDRATGDMVSATPIARDASSKKHKPAAYSPRTQLLYIPYQSTAKDSPYLAVNAGMSAPSVAPGNRGRFTAWDPVGKRAVWNIEERFPIQSGALVSGGDVVFYGTMDGKLKAVNARTGKPLWRWAVNSEPIGQPITYRGKDGKQYVAVLAGKNGNTLYTFALP